MSAERYVVLDIDRRLFAVRHLFVGGLLPTEVKVRRTDVIDFATQFDSVEEAVALIACEREELAGSLRVVRYVQESPAIKAHWEWLDDSAGLCGMPSGLLMRQNRFDCGRVVEWQLSIDGPAVSGGWRLCSACVVQAAMWLEDEYPGHELTRRSLCKAT